MIINITQHCTLCCPHCMQNASPDRTEFMNRETFENSLLFARKIKSKFILISGGEPTSHPDFLTFLDLALSNIEDFHVSIISNGTFIRDHNLVAELAKRVKRYDYRLKFQITSIKGLYSNYDELHKPGLKAARLLGESYILCDKNSDIKLLPLGRAAKGIWCERAESVNAFPSCTNNALIAAQFPNMGIHPGRTLEYLSRFCAPIVSHDGSIRMGESEQCKVIANINDTHEEILKAIVNFRPCGGCASYKWRLANPQTEQEKQIVSTLNK